MSKIIHSMIRVLDLDLSLKFYAECLGLHPSHRLDFPGFSLVYLRNAENDAEIELTWNRDRKEPYSKGDRPGYAQVACSTLVGGVRRGARGGSVGMGVYEG